MKLLRDAHALASCHESTTGKMFKIGEHHLCIGSGQCAVDEAFGGDAVSSFDANVAGAVNLVTTTKAQLE
jgi:hypothetical protein